MINQLTYKNQFSPLNNELISKKYTIIKVGNDSITYLKLNKDSIFQVLIHQDNGCKLDTIVKLTPVYPIKLSIKFPQKITRNKINETGLLFIDTILQKYSINKVIHSEIKSPLRLIDTKFEIYTLDSVVQVKAALNAVSYLLDECLIQGDSNFEQIYESNSAPGHHPNDFLGSYTSNPHNLAAMRMPEVWNITRESPFIVGVIEPGGFPNIFHEDLSGNVVNSPIWIGQPNTISQHATRVAGIISAKTNNNLGVASVGHGVLSNFISPPAFNHGHISSALKYFYDANIKIVSISYSGSFFDPKMQKLINDYAILGMIIVASSGNDNYEANLYPASYDNVISVTGAATENVSGANPSTFFPGVNFPNVLNDYSVNFNNIVFEPTEHTYGTKVDICAPSKKVPTTGGQDAGANLDNEYVDAHGTSFASPAVAAAISLILSQAPCLHFKDIEFILKETARPISDDVVGKPFHNKLGAGFIDVKAALDFALAYQANKPLIITNGETYTIKDSNNYYTSIVVQSGAELHIENSIIRMSPNSSIMIQAGGKLFANNSIFKLNKSIGCNQNEVWEGFIVRGSGHFSNSDLTKNGFLSLTNNCEVLDAKTCIRVGAGNSAGGRITIDNSHFQVLKNGIYFNPYSKPSLSIISNSEFSFPVNIPIIPSTISSHTQVGIKVEHIISVRIQGCKFYAEEGGAFRDYINLYPMQTDFSKRIAIGIQTLNSSVKIEKIKSLPGQMEVLNEFLDIRYGIHSTSFNPTRVISISGCKFKDCSKSIYSDGAKISAEQNSFEMSRVSSFSNIGEGLIRKHQILLHNSNSSIIQNNTFRYIEGFRGVLGHPSDEEKNCPSSEWGPYYLGVLSNNSDPLIVGNNFINAFRNIQLEDDNFNTPIYCNTHNRHIDAITVYGLPSKFFGHCNFLPEDPNNKFINTFQYGDLANYALPNKSSDFDYLSKSSNTLRPTIEISPNYSVRILGGCDNGNEISIQNCDNYSSSSYLGELKEDFSLLGIKKQLLKNGSNQSLIELLNTVNQNNANQIFLELNKYSPYLSKLVLEKFIEKSYYFVDSQIVKIAFDHSKLDPNIFSLFLELPTFEPNSVNYELLQEMQNQPTSAIELLNSEISILKANINIHLRYVTDSLLNLYNFDSIFAGNSSVIDTATNFLGIYSQEISTEKTRALMSLSTNNLDSFNSISSRVFTASEIGDINTAHLYLNNSKDRTNDSAWINTILYQNALTIIADTNNWVSSFYAGFSNFYFDSNYHRLPWHYPIQILGKRKATNNENIKIINSTKINLFPNPNSGSFTVTSGNKSMHYSKAKVINITGQEISFSKTFNPKSNTITFQSIHKLSPQILFLIIEFEDHTTETLKIRIHEN